MTTLRELATKAYGTAVAPPPSLTVDEWADRYRVLHSAGSSEPGPYRTDRAPYLREIMRCLSVSSPIQTVILMKSAQVGATELAFNLVGYTMHIEPGPILYVFPTLDMAKTRSTQTVGPMIGNSVELARLVGTQGFNVQRTHSGGTSALMKSFPGGVLIFAGANAPAGLRSMPIQRLIFDELDAAPLSAGREGDPLALALARTRTFPLRKIFIPSTPTVTGASRIEDEFEQTDKRRYFVPCPECGEYQHLVWSSVVWTAIGRPPREAAYRCECCGSLWEERQKNEIVARGEWRATAECDDPTKAGFHINALYSPWTTWGDVADRFMAAKDNAMKLKAWTNTDLGESFLERGSAPDWSRLYERREPIRIGIVPAEAALVTCGVDVQADRLEAQLWAWGPRQQCWIFDHRVIDGNPYEGDVWRRLDELLRERFRHESGALVQIERVAVDTGGHWTAEVYAWGRKYRSTFAMLVKGGTDATRVPVSAPKVIDAHEGRRTKVGATVWTLGVSVLKDELYGRLALAAPTDGEDYPEGYIHIGEFPAEQFRQLTAERRITRRKPNGFPEVVWELHYHRNEFLDMAVYNLAAGKAAKIDQLADEDWVRIRGELGMVRREPEPERAEPEPEPARTVDPWYREDGGESKGQAGWFDL